MPFASRSAAATASAAAIMAAAPAAPLPEEHGLDAWAMWGARAPSTAQEKGGKKATEDKPRVNAAKRRRSPLAEMEGARRLHERRGGMALCPLDLLASAGLPRLCMDDDANSSSSSSSASSGSSGGSSGRSGSASGSGGRSASTSISSRSSDDLSALSSRADSPATTSPGAPPTSPFYFRAQ